MTPDEQIQAAGERLETRIKGAQGRVIEQIGNSGKTVARSLELFSSETKDRMDRLIIRQKRANKMLFLSLLLLGILNIIRYTSV